MTQTSKADARLSEPRRKLRAKLSATINNYNIVIAGVGGQGLITLLKVLAEAAQRQGYDLASSELHGLSQRGGSVQCHIRFGKEIFSPLVRQGGADLIISLEAEEALKSCYYASKTAKTIFLVNNFFSQIACENPIKREGKKISGKDILKTLRKFSAKATLIPANQICQKELQTELVAGIYILGYAVFNDILPLKSESVISAIKKIIPEKYLELNLKAFNLAKS